MVTKNGILKNDLFKSPCEPSLSIYRAKTRLLMKWSSESPDFVLILSQKKTTIHASGTPPRNFQVVCSRLHRICKLSILTKCSMKGANRKSLKVDPSQFKCTFLLHIRGQQNYAVRQLVLISAIFDPQMFFFLKSKNYNRSTIPGEVGEEAVFGAACIVFEEG